MRVDASLGSGRRAAIFLDRDGVIIRDLGYVSSPERVEFLPGAVSGLRRIRELGYAVVVVTNQSGIARGLYSESDVQKLHAWMQQRLSAQGAEITRFYFCPHHPTEGDPKYRRLCDCRKPAPGMILRAMRDLELDPLATAIAGDRITDLEAGKAAGIPLRIRVGPVRYPAAIEDAAVYCEDLEAVADVLADA